MALPRSKYVPEGQEGVYHCFSRRGILQMTAAEYFELLDRSGRMTRADNRGAIDAHLAQILLRIGANPEGWLGTISRFGSKFRLAAGLLCNLRSFADQLGKRWRKAVAPARAAFASAALQPVSDNARPTDSNAL